MSDVCTIKRDFLSQVKLDVQMFKQVTISAARGSEQDMPSTPVDVPRSLSEITNWRAQAGI
jgi:hypothetical protein